MEYIIDIVFIAVVLLCIVIGYKKGFVKSLTDFLTKIIALFGARIFSSQLAPKVYENYFEQGLLETVSKKISSSGSNTSAKIKSAVNSLPDSLNGFMKLLGIDKAQISSSLSEEVSKNGDNLTQLIMDKLVSPVSVFIIRAILFVICFFIISIILAVIVKLLLKITKLPVIKQANELLGLVLGLFKGVVISLVLAFIIELLAGFIHSEGFINAVEGSRLMNVFLNFLGQVKLSL